MNIKSAWIGANKTIPKYGHYSTMGENEISSVTALVYGFGNYPPKNKLQYGLEEEQQTHSPVTREITRGSTGQVHLGMIIKAA